MTIFGHFRSSKTCIMYETLIEKCLFWFKWALVWLPTISRSRDMKFGHFCFFLGQKSTIKWPPEIFEVVSVDFFVLLIVLDACANFYAFITKCTIIPLSDLTIMFTSFAISLATYQTRHQHNGRSYAWRHLKPKDSSFEKCSLWFPTQFSYCLL